MELCCPPAAPQLPAPCGSGLARHPCRCCSSVLACECRRLQTHEPNNTYLYTLHPIIGFAAGAKATWLSGVALLGTGVICCLCIWWLRLGRPQVPTGLLYSSCSVKQTAAYTCRCGHGLTWNAKTFTCSMICDTGFFYNRQQCQRNGSAWLSTLWPTLPGSETLTYTIFQQRDFWI